MKLNQKMGFVLFLVVVIQIILMIVLTVPIGIALVDYIQIGSIYEIIFGLSMFAIALFLTFIILKSKLEYFNRNLLIKRLVAIYFITGVISCYPDGFTLFNMVAKIIGYPLVTFLIINKYSKTFSNKQN